MKLSIDKQIILGVGVLMGLTFTISGLGYYFVSVFETQAVEIEHQAHDAFNMSELEIALLGQVVYMREYLDSYDEVHLELEEFYREESLALVSLGIDSAVLLGESEHVSVLESFKVEMIDLGEVSNAIIAAVQVEDFETADSLDRDVFEPAILELTSTLEELVDDDVSSLGARISTAVEEAVLAENIFLLSILISVLLGLAMAAYLVKAATRTQRVMKSSLEQILEASESLAATTQQAAASSQQNSSIAQQLSAGSVQQSEQTRDVSRMLADISASIQQLSSGAQEVAASSSSVSTVAKQAGEMSEKSQGELNGIKSVFGDTQNMVGDLSQIFDQISEIVQTITGIADQTNLLALNAAIEAARAGDAGRGFAVVADEVRKLAEESNQAAEEIRGLVSGMSKQMGDTTHTIEQGKTVLDGGMTSINETLAYLAKIVTDVQGVSSTVQELSSAVEQQSSSTQNITSLMDSIAAVASQNSAGAQQLSAASQQQSAANQQIVAATQQLQSLAGEMGILLGKNIEVAKKADSSKSTIKPQNVQKLEVAMKNEHATTKKK